MEPMLLRGALPLSKVPPARLMRPELVGKLADCMRILVLRAVGRVPVAELVMGPVKMRLPPVASMVALLVTGEAMRPAPWMELLLVMVPPERVEAGEPTWMVPLLVMPPEARKLPPLRKRKPVEEMVVRLEME